MDKTYFLFHYWQQITWFQPVYDQGGNCTIIQLVGGKKVSDKRKTKSVLKALAKVFAIDLAALRKKYGQQVGRKSSTPLPFHPQFILIPVKTRQPMFKDDGSWGYIVKTHIKRWEALDQGVRVHFQDGSYLDCFQKPASLKLILSDAEVIERDLKNEWMVKEDRPAENFKCPANNCNCYWRSSN